MWRTARSCTAPPMGAASQDVTPLHGCRCWSCQDRHGQNGISSDGGCGSPLPAGVPLQPMQRRSAGIPHPLCCRRRTPLPHWEGVQQSGWAGANVLPAEQEHPSSPEGERLPESCALHRLCGAYSTECFRLKAAPCGPVAGELLCKTPSPTCDTVTSYLLQGCNRSHPEPHSQKQPVVSTMLRAFHAHTLRCKRNSTPHAYHTH